MTDAIWHMFSTHHDGTLRTARAVLPGRPGHALDLLDGAIQTRHPRLRNRIGSACAALNRGDHVAADEWIERAVVYEMARQFPDGSRLATDRGLYIAIIH